MTSDFQVVPVRFTDRRVQDLVREAEAELDALYADGDAASIALTDFDPPDGAFFGASHPTLGLVSCAGWRRHGDDAELKRMFTRPAGRRRGLAKRLLDAVEESAGGAGCERVILEVGDRQPEAVIFYESRGYERIADFGHNKDYHGVRSYARRLK